MTTFAALKTNVSRDLRDTGNLTFDVTVVGDFINEALAEIGRIAPKRFQKDISLSADAMTYTVLPTGFNSAVPEIELMTVELWHTTETPDVPVALIEPSSTSYVNYSATGWRMWDGVLQIPRWIPVYVKGSESSYLLRVWGYCPYPPLINTGDTVPLSNELEHALRARCRVSGIERLINDRDLFSQWQVRSNNTDVSPAALMNSLSLAQADWRRLSRQIAVLREAP